jgi:peptidoglycan hydrolase-like protein with peptidoglycan-binding domain
VLGTSAARAHNLVTAAHLVADTGGEAATAIVTGATPSGAVKIGTRVLVHAVPAPQIMRGASGSWVKIAQTDLNKAGARLAVDGSYGAATAQAAWDFQARHGLRSDGVTGPATWAALGGL